MNDTPTPFAPFQPSPPVQPETPAKEPRQKRKKAAATPAAPAEQPPRQKRKKAAKTQRSPKFDLQSILSAASSLKEADMPAFEKLIGILQDAGKPGRERLLAAIGKIFA